MHQHTVTVMNPIFWPRLNRVLRRAMRPFGKILPVDWQPRVTGIITIELDNYHSIQLACNPTSFAAKRLFFEGTEGYEPETFRMLRALAPQTDVFLDIGANLGYYSLVSASYNPKMKIKSFEPLPGPYHYLRKNIRLNNFEKIETLKLALSSSRGEDVFHYTVDSTFAEIEHHLTSTGSLDQAAAQQYDNARSCNVTVETVDQYVSSELEGHSVDLMKIDTESTEHLVLEGATGVLSDQRPVIICEVLADASHEYLRDLQMRHDYNSYRIGKNGIIHGKSEVINKNVPRNKIMVPTEKMGILDNIRK